METNFSSSLVVFYKWSPFSCRLVIMRHEWYLLPQCCFAVDPHSSVFGGPLQTEDDIKYSGGLRGKFGTNPLSMLTVSQVPFIKETLR